MTNVKSILVALTLVLTTTAVAATEPVTNVKPATTAEIGELLEDPNFILEEEATARVTFVLNKNHEIVVLSVDTDNETVERYVKYRLNYHKIEATLEQGKSYIVPIRITAES